MSSPTTRKREWALMLRGIFVLLYKKASVEPLVDDDYEFERARNASYKKSKEQHRIDYTPTVLERLQRLRRNLSKSFVVLVITTAIAFLVSYLRACSIPNLIGAASLFFLAWPTLEKLGYSIKSFGGDTVVERLDDFIFSILFLLGTFLGILALA
jgi:Mg2+/citrate symporter